MKPQKVYIADYETISSLGTGNERIFNSLKTNFCAERTIERFDPSGMPFTRAAAITDDLSPLYREAHPKLIEACYYDKKLEMLVALYYLMKTRLHQLFSQAAPTEKGVILGVGINVTPLLSLEKTLDKLSSSQGDLYIRAVDSLITERCDINPVLNAYDLYPVILAHELQLYAFQKPILTACAASTQAIAFGYDAIRYGEAQVVLAGGTDSIINDIAFMSFGKLGVLAETENESEVGSCKPFDISRNGTLAGEAAGFSVLMSEEAAEKAGINPAFELLGYGNTLDAYKITAPDPNGKGMARAIRAALTNSGIRPEEIDYINLHGTGTRANDEVELLAFREVFGDALNGIPLSSTKDRHGHAIAAAGILEFNILCMCMENHFIPCNLNLRNPIGDHHFDLVMHNNRDKQITIGLSNNFAFGGVNTVLVLKRLT
ncbi:MAG: beta-ketoacyl-[acyl-carrier-protein] synthase family protein [Bacteroidetes bacterium]|nr:beta-ketoacyl-[acyl-carrier-protein] synthase family protein [Bacteroidota bacterium]